MQLLKRSKSKKLSVSNSLMSTMGTGNFIESSRTITLMPLFGSKQQTTQINQSFFHFFFLHSISVEKCKVKFGKMAKKREKVGKKEKLTEQQYELKWHCLSVCVGVFADHHLHFHLHHRIGFRYCASQPMPTLAFRLWALPAQSSPACLTGTATK
jgi:hypothetical protein